MRQGRVAWRKDWVSTYGAARSHIPTLDEHIRFANFDLSSQGDLPLIEKDQQGGLFVRAIRVFDETELAELYAEMQGQYVHPQRVNSAFREDVLQPLARVAHTLDVVGYHGFAPAEDNAGIRFLRTLIPAGDITIEFPDDPGAGL